MGDSTTVGGGHKKSNSLVRCQAHSGWTSHVRRGYLDAPVVVPCGGVRAGGARFDNMPFVIGDTIKLVRNVNWGSDLLFRKAELRKVPVGRKRRATVPETGRGSFVEKINELSSNNMLYLNVSERSGSQVDGSTS